MRIIKLDSHAQNKVLKETLDVLKRGGLVVSPSDTVYGLLADANNLQAVEELIQFKNRPPGKPISVFLPNFKSIREYVKVNKKNLGVLQKLLPGPFTIVLKSKHKVLQRLESEKQTLGIRLPNYQFILDLVSKFGSAVTATSANLASKAAVYNVDTLLKTLPKLKLELIDLIIDAGKLPLNKPSTVIDLVESEIKILRQGDILPGQIFISNSPDETKQIAQKIFKKVARAVEDRPIVFILEGELGVGKTVFAKGIGELLGIKDIISPTFVIYYEYPVNVRAYFYHFDLYQIEEEAEFEQLKIDKLLVSGNILCFEWGEKAGAIFDLLKKKGKVVYVKMKYFDEKKRKVSWNITN